MSFTWHVHARYKRGQPDGPDAGIDQDGALAALRSAGYHGCVSVEYEGKEPGSSAVPRAPQYLRGAIGRQRQGRRLAVRLGVEGRFFPAAEEGGRCARRDHTAAGSRDDSS